MKTKIFSFLLVICAIMCACNNNIEEPEIFIEVVTDTVPKIILYNEDSVKLIKNGNPIIFEIKGFVISYFLKNNGEYSTEFTYGDSIEVGWTIKNIQLETDSIYASYRSIGACWDIKQRLYGNLSRIPQEPKEIRITGVDNIACGGIDKIELKSQETFSYSYFYPTNLLDNNENDFYFEPRQYTIGTIVNYIYEKNEIYMDDIWGIWQFPPSYNISIEKDLLFLSNVIIYTICPNIKIYFKVV